MSPSPDAVPEELLLGQFIPLHYHFNMLRDRSRMEPFREAIEYAVPIGGKVVELGGGTGVLSWFAAQRADRVWCVERNPALVRAARQFLANNDRGDRVAVVQSDAMMWLPPEPVDVVICEMLHVALIREKQVAVLRSFQERYLAMFGPPLPAFIPDASLLAVQLREQDYCFSGYRAPVPMFLEPTGHDDESRSLAEPQIYSTIYWGEDIPTEFASSESILVRKSGRLNAVSFLTNNFLAFLLAEQRGVQWMMNQLLLPLPEPIDVRPGDTVDLRIAYQAGCAIESLQEAIVVERRSAVPWQRAA